MSVKIVGIPSKSSLISKCCFASFFCAGERASELCVREYLYIDRQRYRYAVDTLSFDRFKSGFVSGLSFGKFPRKKENSTFVHSRYQERLIQQKKIFKFIHKFQKAKNTVS